MQVGGKFWVLVDSSTSKTGTTKMARITNPLTHTQVTQTKPKEKIYDLNDGNREEKSRLNDIAHSNTLEHVAAK